MVHQLYLKSSPHIESRESIPKIMWSVFFSLIPAASFGVYVFGLGALKVILLCIFSCVITEAIIQKIKGEKITIYDGSAAVSGLLLAMVLPPNLPWFVPVVGGIFAMGIVKHAFGGLGNNIWNPALAARAFLQFSYSSYITMSKWPILAKFYSSSSSADSISMPTPLVTYMKYVKHISDNAFYSYKDLFLGTVPGCIGETSALFLLIGGIFLILRGYIKWQVPLCYIGTVFLLSWILPLEGKWFIGDPFYQILAGGLFLGAFFMATDMVTTPLTTKGQIIFGIGCGLLTTVIRYYGGYPEGVCYSILIMNTFVPLIDRYTKPSVFGKEK